MLVFLFNDFKGFVDSVAFIDEFFLFWNERVGVWKGVEFSATELLAADGFILEVGVFEEEFIDEFGIEIFLFKLSFRKSAFDGLVTG